MGISFKNRMVRIPVLLGLLAVLMTIMSALSENVPGSVKALVVGLFVLVLVAMEFYFC